METREDGAAAVALAKSGDVGAFRLLVEQHSRSLFRLAYRMTGNQQDAEDVVQETFLRAHRGFPGFEGRAQVGTWLRRITTNCALDAIRSRQRRDRNRVHDAPGFGDEGRPASILERAASKDPEPDRLILSAQIQEKVAWALGRLSPVERAAFTLRHFEGQGIEEIGESLGLNPGATKNTVFRAVAKLRHELRILVDNTDE